MDRNWNFYKREYYNALAAAESEYAEQVKTDEIAYQAYLMAKTALYALEKRMDELAKLSDIEDDC